MDIEEEIGVQLAIISNEQYKKRHAAKYLEQENREFGTSCTLEEYVVSCIDAIERAGRRIKEINQRNKKQ